MACTCLAMPSMEAHLNGLKIGKKNKSSKATATILSNSTRPAPAAPAVSTPAGAHQKAVAAIPEKLRAVLENLASR
jgi:hypothetical protein